jgi:diacylglycerol kinase family enzyme
VAEIQAALSQSGYIVKMTTDLDELRGLSLEATQANALRAVISLGGDGTASIVRNHVPLDIPLVAVPMGTENLLGRYLNQTSAPADVCHTIDEGVSIEFDIGRAGSKYFLVMFSAGFDAEVIRSLHANRRGNITRRAYFLPTLRAISSYEFPPMQLYWDGAGAAGAEPRACRWLFAFNLPLYAMGLPIAPEAVATDGLLDVCTFERGTVWNVARYAWHVMRRGHMSLSDAALTRSQRVRLEATDGREVAYQLDGDYAGTLPVDVEVLPGQLRLMVPPQTVSRLGFAMPIDPAGLVQRAGDAKN